MDNSRLDTQKAQLYTQQQVEEIAQLAAKQAIRDFFSALNLDNGIHQNNSLEALTVQQAAELIGISKPKMYEIVQSKAVRSINIGKKILISRRSLLEWLQGGE